MFGESPPQGSLFARGAVRSRFGERRFLMFQIDFQSRTPVYLQIRERVLELVVTDVLSPGDRLPSVRSLAAELGVNPNTVQKALRELESEGVIRTVTGKGCFVGGRETAELLMRNRVGERLRNALLSARRAGFSLREARDMVNGVYGGDETC